MHPRHILSWLGFVLSLAPASASAAAAAAGAQPRSTLGAVAPTRNAVTLVDGERAPVIIAPNNGAGRKVAGKLRDALARRLGMDVGLVERYAEADPGERTAIALGNMLDNELLTRLYWSRYTYEDALFPGPDGYTVHAVFDPHHWAGGRDVIVLGASRSDRLGQAAARFLALLRGDGRSTTLPYAMIVEPVRPLPPATRARLASAPVAPSFTAFRTHAEQYLKTGEETHARLAIAALDIMIGIYKQNPTRHVPWPEETTSGEIFAAWDAFEECPLVGPERRRAALDAFLAWSRNLTRRSYEYRAIDERFGPTWNHTTFALLGLYHAGRYFARHCGSAEARDWLRKARLGFAGQARSWKPLEDADGYLVCTMGHTVAFALADWDLRFFESGLIRRYADYVVGCGDNRQWPAGFGDSGYSQGPTLAGAALPAAYWWTRDAGYRWVLDRAFEGAWRNPFWPDVEPRRPDHFTGLTVFSMDRQIYDDTQRRPTYNEAFEPAQVPFERAWDKLSFRESWEPDGQYMLLDGLGRGKHLHFDTNAITTFVQDGERWLLDHDYLVRNTTEHTMLSVLRDGRCTRLVPSLAELVSSGDLPQVAATRTCVSNYNGIDWDRRILWSKGAWFLVQDTVTAREPGDYDLDLTWKTIDQGDQRVGGDGRFVARRARAHAGDRLTIEDDPLASGGKTVLFASRDACLILNIELSKGDYAIGLAGSGSGTGSDSVFLSIDGGAHMTVGVPVKRQPPRTPARPPASATVRCTIPSDGLHKLEITLRERPPVRIDRIEFRRADAPAKVVEAEDAIRAGDPPPPPPPPTVLHIDPALPVRAWVTNHVRQGIAVPVSILHQRQSIRLAPGATTTFRSLVHATGTKHPAEFGVEPLRSGACRVTSATCVSAVGFGPDRAGRWQCDADAWVVRRDTADLIAARALTLGDAGLAFNPVANVNLDLGDGRATVSSAQSLVVTARGGATVNGQARLQLSPGTHIVALGGIAPAALGDALLRDAHPPAPVRSAGNAGDRPGRPAAHAPLWSVVLSAGSPVSRITPADITGDNRPELLVACGNAGHAVAADGARLWTHPTDGMVRDVAAARFARGAPPTILVSSADTYLRQLDPVGGILRRKDQMTGLYFNVDHGERPWGLYCTRAVDADSDGADDLIVTTLASMESQGLAPDATRRWRTLAAYHGCMDMGVEDVDGKRGPEIVIANKYGTVFVLRPDGTRLMRSSTSIGDVAFALADLDGDGVKEIVHGSSTGDLVAVDLGGKILWRFDNYGYPVERIRSADLERDGRPDLIVASGTGRLYRLDAAGDLVWERRLGVAVHDVVVLAGLIVAGTEDGEVHALDPAGNIVWTSSMGAPVASLAPVAAPGRPAIAVGLANGRLLALPADP